MFHHNNLTTPPVHSSVLSTSDLTTTGSFDIDGNHLADDSFYMPRVPVADAVAISGSHIQDEALQEREQRIQELERQVFDLQMQGLQGAAMRADLERQLDRIVRESEYGCCPPVNGRTIRASTVVSICMLGIGAMAGICGVGKCRRRFSPVPTSPPVPTPTPPPPRDSFAAQSILTYINSITLSGRDWSEMDYTTTTEGRAIQWLIYEDRRTLASDELALRQRYALTALWFQQPNNASSSSSPIRPIDDDDFMAHSATWANPNYRECQWLDVTCDSSDRVIGLSLPSNLVMGRIPDDLALLSTLQELQLEGNALTGPITSTLGRMSALTVLRLSDNRLTGEIPSSLANLTVMKTLELSTTQLNGTIPSALDRLTTLKELQLKGNALTGEIPSSLANLTIMKTLDLSINQLNGTIPSALDRLTALQELIMAVNQLSGTIPSSLTALTALQKMWLYDNVLTGTVPSLFSSLTALTSLWLFDNRLNGSMPFCLLSYQTKFDGFLVSDCKQVSCPCCTHCCPIAQGATQAFAICKARILP
jgi:hypothetical protein